VGVVVLIRGINVGSHHRVRMPELVAACEAAGLGRPAAHLQSGNLVFDDDAVAAAEVGSDAALDAGAGGTEGAEPDAGSAPAASRRPEDLAEGVAAVLAAEFEVDARCLGLSPARLAAALASVPDAAQAEEKLTHLVFWEPPAASGAERFAAGRAELLAAAGEGAFGEDRLILGPDHAVILYRESSRGSRLTLARLERALGVAGAARNLRTVRALTGRGSAGGRSLTENRPPTCEHTTPSVCHTRHRRFKFSCSGGR
jgi:uncharacterized protein (DUF1697 family)